MVCAVPEPKGTQRSKLNSLSVQEAREPPQPAGNDDELSGLGSITQEEVTSGHSSLVWIYKLELSREFQNDDINLGDTCISLVLKH